MGCFASKKQSSVAPPRGSVQKNRFYEGNYPAPRYLFWSGSPFKPSNATGSWHHRGIWRGLAYPLELLFGTKGFLLHQPAMILAVLGGVAVMIVNRALLPELPEMLFSFAWSGASWPVYAWGSTNLSGVCATIRWLEPLLAPGYYVLLMVLVLSAPSLPRVPGACRRRLEYCGAAGQE